MDGCSNVSEGVKAASLLWLQKHIVCRSAHKPALSEVKVKVTSSDYPGRGMAQKGAHMDQGAFSCSICLDLPTDPVTIPCGHSYCMSCIQSCWDGQDEDAVCRCPQCRQIYVPRPVLVKSTMLAALVEELKRTGLRAAAAADPCCAGPEDVACDVCKGRRLKASKSCLDCLLSYCEKHLQPHHDAAPLKKHQLVEPCSGLRENVCPRHDEAMKMFCRTDQQTICYLCSVGEHRGHDAVAVAAERTERQKGLQGRRQEIQQRIRDREKEVELLRQEAEAIDGSADKSAKDSGRMLDELILVLQARRSEVKQRLRSQQETGVRGVRERQEKLKREISELRRTDSELEQLARTRDHNHFLRRYPSASPLGKSTALPVRPLVYFDRVTAAVSEVREKLQGVLEDTWTNVLLAVAETDVLLSTPQPKTRAEFLSYSRDIALDPNTAHNRLRLSNGNRKATCVETVQPYPDHPERFTGCAQVLSAESLTGRCYWEVECRGEAYVSVAVAYKSIGRAGGRESRFGHNGKSWALNWDPDGFTFLSNNVLTPVPGPRSSRIGVYLDHSAGLLSFYSVSDSMALLHRVHTTFARPLHAGLLLLFDTKAEICKLSSI